MTPAPPPDLPLVIAGREVQLTRQRRRLFDILSERPGRIFTKRELLIALDTSALYKLLDVQLFHLRRSLSEPFIATGDVPPIQINNHWGLGTSLTYGPFTGAISGVRWTPNRKRDFVVELDQKYAISDEAARLHCEQYPEITEEMIRQWMYEEGRWESAGKMVIA